MPDARDLALEALALDLVDAEADRDIYRDIMLVALDHLAALIRRNERLQARLRAHRITPSAEDIFGAES